MKIISILKEPLILRKIPACDHLSYINQYINELGLQKNHLDRYPYQLSGGQLQRVSIARALLMEPSIIITDEPTSAVDAPLRGQIIQLLKKLVTKHGISLILITHDLENVKNIAQHVAVMYHGLVIEKGEGSIILNNPIHPYTERLLHVLNNEKTEHKYHDNPNLWYQLSNQWDQHQGCPFIDVCKNAKKLCKQSKPDYQSYGHEHIAWCQIDKKDYLTSK